jgi:hypothetical protein
MLILGLLALRGGAYPSTQRAGGRLKIFNQ